MGHGVMNRVSVSGASSPGDLIPLKTFFFSQAVGKKWSLS